MLRNSHLPRGYYENRQDEVTRSRKVVLVMSLLALVGMGCSRAGERPRAGATTTVAAPPTSSTPTVTINGKSYTCEQLFTSCPPELKAAFVQWGKGANDYFATPDLGPLYPASSRTSEALFAGLMACILVRDQALSAQQFGEVIKQLSGYANRADVTPAHFKLPYDKARVHLCPELA